MFDDIDENILYSRYLEVKALRRTFPDHTPEQLADVIAWRALPGVLHRYIDTIENTEDKALSREMDQHLFEMIVGLSDEHPFMRTVLMVLSERGY